MVIETNSGIITYQRKPAVLSIIRDITERKRAEEALQESEEKYRILFENAHDAIFITQDGVIKFPNPKVLELIGYREEELAKISFADLIHPEDKEMVVERYKRRMKGDKDIPSMYSHRAVNKAGNELIVDTNVVRIDWEGRPPAGLNFVRDVTHQKTLESQLQEAIKMEAIGTLAGGIAHQFNNALSVILGNIERLLWDLPEDENIRKYVKPIKDTAHRLSSLTNQLLAYARGGKYQAKTISLSDFIRDTLPLIEYTITSPIYMDTDLPKDVLPVKADLTQMQMVLSAILTNASETMEDNGGRIRISTRNQEFDEEFLKSHSGLKPGPHVCLKIEDNGKGMDETTKSRIFEPFFTTKFQGRGLGMAASYGIVKNHGGSILVDSTLGVGTTVRIYLPALEVEKKKAKEEKVELVKGTGTILVIEDEKLVMDENKAMLERLGFQVLEAMTGKEAITIAKNFDGDIHLALLDIVLPDMSVKDIYSQLMKAQPNMKVIVCSGYSIDGPAQEILDEGAQDFIQKPFSLSIISEKLNKILKNK